MFSTYVMTIFQCISWSRKAVLRMRGKFKFLILFVLLGQIVFANDCKKCLKRPDRLSGYVRFDMISEIYNGNININSFGLKRARKPLDYWRVWSDRNGNEVFEQPHGQIPARSKTMSFMEPAVVIGISDNGKHLELAREERVLDEWFYKRIGFVPIANLLITDRALLNENGIVKKNIVVANLEEIENLPEDSSVFRFYDAPDCESIRSEATELEIRFVLKQIKGTKLLSQTSRLSGIREEKVKEFVDGWMMGVQAVDWDTRVCLEPNYGSKMTQTFGSRPLPLFLNLKDLDLFQKSRAQSYVYKSHIASLSRMPLYERRWPVLVNFNGGTRKIAVLSNQSNEEISVPEVEESIRILEQRKDNINLLFVIDATSTMKEYFPAVQRGIKSIIEVNMRDYGKRVKFGISLYRDYEDSKTVEVQPMTRDANKLFDFLAQAEAHSIGGTVHEAVYTGIADGIDRSKMIKGESNVVILIGESGNYRNDPKGKGMDDVVKKLKEYNASFLAFQVYWDSHEAYRHFNDDAIEIAKEGVGKNSQNGFKGFPMMINIKGSRNAYELRYRNRATRNTESHFEGSFARFIRADDQEMMPITLLQKQLFSSLDDYMKMLDGRIEDLRKKLRMVRNGQYLNKGEEGPLRRHLKREGKTDEQIDNFFARKNLDYCIYAYSNLRVYGKSMDWLYPVVYLLDDEVEEILEFFDAIDQKAAGNELKEQVVQAITIMAKNALGEDNEDLIRVKTLDEIWNVLLGIPFDPNKRFGDLGEERLMDIKKMKFSKIEPWLLEVKSKVGRFNPGFIEQNGITMKNQTIYWIPYKSFPGSG